jgi:predicted DNA-binding transcriptional regulator AlpA
VKLESEVIITVPLVKVQKRVVEATCASRRTLFRIVKEGKSVKNGATMAFPTPHKLRPKMRI